MKLRPVVQDDLEKIKSWISVDSWHKDVDESAATWFLTGRSKLSFCLEDDKGPLCFVRLDSDKYNFLRIMTQFGPEEEVSKLRLIKGMTKFGIPAARIFAGQSGYSGLIFESESKLLIEFMKRQGFKEFGLDNYALIFEDK